MVIILIIIAFFMVKSRAEQYKKGEDGDQVAEQCKKDEDSNTHIQQQYFERF